MKLFLVILLLLNFPLVFSGENNFQKIANNTHFPGAFDLYFVLEKNNIILDKKDAKTIWESHFEINNKIQRLSHHMSDHSLPYEYDSHVPLIFYSPTRVKKGNSDKQVDTASLIPTLTESLKIAPPPYALSPALTEWQKDKMMNRPKAILVFIMDAGGELYWKTHYRFSNFFKTLHDEGFVYSNAQLNFGISGTAPSHAVFGTGTYPKYNHVHDNRPFVSALQRSENIYQGVAGYDPMQLAQPTLIDLWNKSSALTANVLVYAGASRAAIGMAGHGSLYAKDSQNLVFWYDSKLGKFDTEKKAYALPFGLEKFSYNDYIKLNNESEYWKSANCSPQGMSDSDCIQSSPAFAQMEGDVLINTLSKRQFGLGPTTDLIFINFKGTDYCGHRFGVESMECRETFLKIENQIERITKLINDKTQGDYLMAFSADHGMSRPIELEGGSIIISEEILEVLNKTFGKKDDLAPVISNFGKTYINVNLPQLKKNGYTLNDIKNFLESYKLSDKKVFKEVMVFE